MMPMLHVGMVVRCAAEFLIIPVEAQLKKKLQHSNSQNMQFYLYFSDVVFWGHLQNRFKAGHNSESIRDVTDGQEYMRHHQSEQT